MGAEKTGAVRHARAAATFALAATALEAAASTPAAIGAGFAFDRQPAPSETSSSSGIDAADRLMLKCTLSERRSLRAKQLAERRSRHPRRASRSAEVAGVFSEQLARPMRRQTLGYGGRVAPDGPIDIGRLDARSACAVSRSAKDVPELAYVARPRVRHEPR